jgi:hypothetical protein
MFETLARNATEHYDPAELADVSTEDITRRVAVLLGHYDERENDPGDELVYLGRELRERFGE